MQNKFRLDRTAFKAMTLQEASETNDYINSTMVERLKVAAYLNSVAYNHNIIIFQKWIELFLKLPV